MYSTVLCKSNTSKMGKFHFLFLGTFMENSVEFSDI